MTSTTRPPESAVTGISDAGLDRVLRIILWPLAPFAWRTVRHGTVGIYQRNAITGRRRFRFRADVLSPLDAAAHFKAIP